MKPDAHIALAAANISIDASRRIVDLLASRPVDAALIAHEADVKTRALLAPSVAPDPTRWIRALHPDGPSIRLRSAIREAGRTSVHVDASEVEAAWPTMSDAQREGWQSVSVTVAEGDNAASLTAPTGGVVGVATAQPDIGVLHDLRRRLLAEDIDALVVVDEDAGGDAVTRVLDTYFTEGAVPARPSQRRVYPHGSIVRVITSQDLDAHPELIAGSILDVAVVLAPISAAALDEVRARLLRNRGTLIGFGAPVLSIRTPAESFADAGPTLSVPIRAEDITITAGPTYPDPTGWNRALRGPAPSTAPTDRRLQVLARLVDVAGAAVGLEDFVASTRAEYPDVFADLDEHLALVRAGIAAAESGPADEDGRPVQHTELCRSRGALTIAESWWCRCSGELAEYHSPSDRVDVPRSGLTWPTSPPTFEEALAEQMHERLEQLSASTNSSGPVFTIEDFEDAVRTLERNATTPPAVVAGPSVARLAGAMDTLAPGWSVDEPLDPELWSQTLDRAQVAALAGERPSLAVQTELREAGWLHRTVESVAPKPEPIGPFHALQAVYEDGGKCWLRVTTTAGTTIFRSTDDGATWTIEATS